MEDPQLGEAEERLRKLLVNGTVSKKTGEWLQGIMRERNRFKQLNHPFPHQTQAVYEIVAKDVTFFGLYHEMGLGKTVTCCMVIAAMYLILGRIPKTVIVCPAGLVGHWKKNLLDWLRILESRFLFVDKGNQLTYEAINDVDIVVVSRELVSQAYGECFHKVERHHQEQTDAGWRWVTAWVERPGVAPHPLFCSGFRTETTEAGIEQRVPVNREYDLFFADEAHDLRNPGSRRVQAFKEISTRCAKRVPVTGTPLLHRTGDVASQCLAMGAPTTPIDFTKPKSWVHEKDYSTLNEKTNKRFMKYVNRATEEILNLPDIVHTAVSYDVGVPETLVPQYNDRIDAARALKLAFDHAPGRVTQADVARLMAILQETQFMAVCPTIAENGAAAVQKNQRLMDKAASEPTGALIALLSELRTLQEQGHMRIVVASMHTSILRVAAKYLDAEGPDTGKTFFYDGDMSHKKRDEAAYGFLTCRVGKLMLSIGAGGQGVHLVPGCEAMILFGSSPWSNAQVDQVCKRIHRMGQTCPKTGSVQIRRLVPYGSVDAAISAVHGCKRRLQKMTVDTWAEDTAARASSGGPSQKKRKVKEEEAPEDEEDTHTTWRRTGRIVDLCHKLKDDGNFGEMPYNTMNAAGEVTGVYTVVPGVITRNREGELPPDAPNEWAEPIQNAPAAPNYAYLGVHQVDADLDDVPGNQDELLMAPVPAAAHA